MLARFRPTELFRVNILAVEELARYCTGYFMAALNLASATLAVFCHQLVLWRSTLLVLKRGRLLVRPTFQSTCSAATQFRSITTIIRNVSTLITNRLWMLYRAELLSCFQLSSHLIRCSTAIRFYQISLPTQRHWRDHRAGDQRSTVGLGRII